ncbi:hypothetical protein EMIHUDRAFT_97602 [Emiliania huxleyi CCMP1516]|uniref:EF-hand domain-containing protein n=2 Tax=Emiliania huxleyi TaxID=2903 RepID=A0A0D3J0E0_EMIH1|nr:hypothetical protein EMIHUDRAFT_118817 [Emiliania huxleyi CCMP1516]XP_005793823.1 hypothetical protein EMIHUDRAFT_97602 [Emiliania huxleyi CCMP1516]EOD16975.1 hypothetical protein EMIHUDRAFT_118817 [Emiliania huxleyi CCMP1516]EOD41394.1 hypothetical protein EMIHUDRAFT_97602 [Emiliania huxleyi CCMP1516]|eukprot:XP_005769404.1 hypothetical protein EMIHUDRAFT_118817 [Emiliania huxleyi CCMP1516]
MLGLTDAHRRDIRRAFDLFDQAGHGVIDVSALRVVFRALGFELGHDEVCGMLSDQSRGANAVDFSEMLTLVQKMGERESSGEHGRAFRLFDSGSGGVSFESLRQVTRGEEMTDEELAEMISSADLDEDGLVSEEEFRHALRGQTSKARDRG